MNHDPLCPIAKPCRRDGLTFWSHYPHATYAGSGPHACAGCGHHCQCKLIQEVTERERLGAK